MNDLLIVQLWNSQWLHIIGLAIGVMSTLYLAGDFLDDRYVFLRVLTQGVTFGIILASFFAFQIILASLLQLISYFIFFHFLEPKSVDTFFHNVRGIGVLLPEGLIVGFTIGFSYGILKESLQKLPLFKVIALLALIGLFIEAFGFLFVYQSALIQYSATLDMQTEIFAELGGFIFGLVLAQIRPSWRISTIFGLLGGATFIIILLYLNFSPNQPLIIDALSDLIYRSFYPFVIGYTVSNYLQPHKVLKKVTWRYCLSWLLGASIIGLGSWFFISRSNIGRDHFNEDKVFLYISLAVGIVCGQGDKIIKQIKPRYKYLQTQLKPQLNFSPLVNSQRLKNGLLIGILYVIPFCIYVGLTDIVINSNRAGLILGLPLSIAYMIEVGLIIGCLYGFGPKLIFTIENLSKRRLGQMGLILALLVFIVAEYSH